MTLWCTIRGAMKWRIAVSEHGLRCASCPTLIGAGEPYRLVTPADRPWCQECAERHLGEFAPAALWAEMPPTDAVPANVQASDIFRPAFATGGTRDGKMAALGDDR